MSWLFLIPFVYLIIIYWMESRVPLRNHPYFTMKNPDESAILIPARNEEENIAKAIGSLFIQRGDFFILVGDDQSYDETSCILDDMQSVDSRLHLYRINEKYLEAKAGVLDVLIEHTADKNTLLFTDADTFVNPNWIGFMEQMAQYHQALVNGITLPEVKGIWSLFQQWDWLLAFSSIYAWSEKKIPVLGVGNNMAVVKALFNKTGGYRNFPLSPTEDLSLMKALQMEGVGTIQLFQKEAMAFTRAAPDVVQLLWQRKRWGSGIFLLSSKAQLILLSRVLYFILLMPALLIHWPSGIVMLLGKSMLDYVILRRGMRHLGISFKSGFLLPLYQLFQASFSVLLLFFLSLPIRIKWKGRKLS